MLEAVSHMPALSKFKLGGGGIFQKKVPKKHQKRFDDCVLLFKVFITGTSGGGDGINSELGKEGGGGGGRGEGGGGGGRERGGHALEGGARERQLMSVWFGHPKKNIYMRPPLVCSLCIGV
jgi:hypothetical protein